MYKIYNNLLPNIFQSLFVFNDTQTRQTRQTQQFRLPFMRLTVSQKCISFVGVKIWNYYVKFIKPDLSIHVFKKKLKKYVSNNDLPSFI
jgi:hypothetical protein